MRIRFSHPTAVSRTIAATAAAAIVVIFAGCMSLSIGGRTSHHVTSESTSEEGIFLQQGVARIKGGGDAEVHYPVAYQRPPNLELGEDSDHCEIIEQHEDYFRIHNSSPFKVEAQWKARGVRTAGAPHGTPPGPPAVPPPDPPPPATTPTAPGTSASTGPTP